MEPRFEVTALRDAICKAKAEAVAQSLKEQGYNAHVYYEMD